MVDGKRRRVPIDAKRCTAPLQMLRRPAAESVLKHKVSHCLLRLRLLLGGGGVAEVEGRVGVVVRKGKAMPIGAA